MALYSLKEERWLYFLLEAMIPGSADGSPMWLPPFTENRIGEFKSIFQRNAPIFLRAGLRLSVWVLTLLPLVWCSGWRLFPELTKEERDQLLARAAASRSYLLRQVVLAVKLVAILGYFHHPSVRSSFQFTLPES